MQRVYYLSALDCAHLSHELHTLFEKSFLIRGALSMYVSESEFMIPIDVNQIVNVLWDLTEDFCPTLLELIAIISATQPIVVMDEGESDAQQGEDE